MKNTLTRLITATIALAAFCSAGVFAATAQVGRPAPDFTAQDIDGKQVKLSDYKGKIVVLEWVNPECPFVKKHYGSGNIPSLQKDARAGNIVWLTINSAAPGEQGDYNAEKTAAWQKATGAAYADYIRDSSGAVGKLYGAKTTPHIFVIDAGGTLVYEGAIDSIRSTNVDDIAKATNYVTAAITSLKNGTPVAKSTTAPYGCPVKY